MESEVTRRQFSEVGASVNLVVVEFGSEESSEKEETIANETMQSALKRVVRFYGAKPPTVLDEDDKSAPDDWMEMTHDKPVPIKYSLEPIYELFVKKNFEMTDVDYEKIYPKLKMYSMCYCYTFKTHFNLPSCQYTASQEVACYLNDKQRSTGPSLADAYDFEYQ